MPSTSAILCALLLCFMCVYSLPANQTGPVIGILTQGDSPEVFKEGVTINSTTTYIAGARVVPVHCEAPEENLRRQAELLNGFLLPGGGQAITDPNNCYARAASFVMTLAKEFNSNGDYFPVWGTCLGFEMVSVFIGGASVLSNGFDSENLPLPLNFTQNLATSRIFKNAPSELITALRNDALTMNNHASGVTPDSFSTSKNLSSFFNVISTNVDRKGRPFVSTIEGKDIPFYATQWHPEKNSFEWTAKENIPHSPLAIKTCQWTATFFVNEARKSNHMYPPKQLMDDIIYNFNPIFTGKTGSGFEQSYFWHN